MFSIYSGGTHTMLKVVLWSLVLYVGYCLLLFLAQRHMLFPRYMMPPLIREERQEIPSLETLWIQTKFGKVEAWFLPPAEQSDKRPAPLVIFAHGNAERIEFCVQEMRQFSHWGIGTLLVEFPGYGRSEGSPSQAGITETFVAAYDLMTRRKDIDASRIILYGKHDEVIPYAHGKSLYQASPNARFLSYECGHNDCPPDWPQFWEDVRGFLRDAGLVNG